MGGPCLQYVRPPYGEHEERLCPPCTDNFQVVPGGFEYDGIIWHSVEQAFQSLKFPMGSIAQVEIERAAPRPDESEASYSMRTWSTGTTSQRHQHARGLGAGQGQDHDRPQYCQVCILSGLLLRPDRNRYQSHTRPAEYVELAVLECCDSNLHPNRVAQGHRSSRVVADHRRHGTRAS